MPTRILQSDESTIVVPGKVQLSRAAQMIDADNGVSFSVGILSEEDDYGPLQSCYHTGTTCRDR
jgi:hypothetical protein